jgi:6-phosphogluconolactonase
MDGYHWEKYVESFDERRDAVIPGSKEKTIQFSIEHFISLAKKSIADHGFFSVALSGGSTPKAIYQGLCQQNYKDQVDWEKVLLFWGDERAVPPDHPDSNYKMAMDAGFNKLPIPPDQIYRMKAETDIEHNALEYEKIIEKTLPNGIFDFVMLGMGDDGHTASLFPKTHGLHSANRLVVANFVPKMDAWRMTLTFRCINHAHNIAIYVIGKSKADMLERVLSDGYDPDNLPVQRVGTSTHKALWIADNEALKDVYLS